MYRRYQNRATWRGPQTALRSAMAAHAIGSAWARQAVSRDSEFSCGVLSYRRAQGGAQPATTPAGRTERTAAVCFAQEAKMAWKLRELAAVGTALGMLAVGSPATAQKQGGILKLYMVDSPASMSIHEESTIYSERPMMGVFNNLVMFDQHVRQNSLNSIVPDLATGWSWDEDGTRLTFKLREGVKWHDGKPFTAKDVKCTWDLLTGKASEKLRINPRKPWYRNLEEVTINGDYEVTFHLKRPQPAFIAVLASGLSPVYPCHVPPRDMRSHPIGTGPFKFVEFKPNEVLRATRNPDYWKKHRPYLDGIDYTIFKNVSTGVLAFASGKVDMTSPYFLQIPVLK